MAETERFIVLRTIRTSTQSIQITFNIAPFVQNNKYSIFGFDLDDNFLWHRAFNSHVLVPPIWGRLYGGVEYLDWLSIQHRIKKFVPEAMIEIDESVGEQGELSFYFATKDDPLGRLQRGEEYGPICIFATAKPDLVERAKQFISKEYSPEEK